MCGIAGIYSHDLSCEAEQKIRTMTSVISHRGPDGEGFWFSDDKAIAFGHRRLSIIDLSENASQPMDFMGKYVITFNGEIYNYLEIKNKLKAKGIIFNTKSDTEVVLAAYHIWKEKCLMEFDGMFAFAIYDREKKEMFCARDRFGEKPFYYSLCENKLAFASEMKAIWAIGCKKKQNEKMLFNYLANDLVENPIDQKDTFFENIFKLKPSHYFIYKGDRRIEQKKYWSIDLSKTTEMDHDSINLKFLELLDTSVTRRLRSDVSIGCSLSGGLDSSTIVSLISKHLQNNYTFSARFNDFERDEGYYIDLVTKQFPTNHHNIFISEEKLIKDLDKLVWHQEEPFQTGSIYAQWCVYEEAKRNNILVMLDGQGADEYLGGYDKDFKSYLKEIYKIQSKKNDFIRSIKVNHNFDVTLSVKDRFCMNFPLFYKALARLKQTFNPIMPEGINSEFYAANKNINSPFKEFDNLKSTLHHEMTNQGLEKLLKFADRNSMAHSIEVRLPFLYHELVEFVFSLQSSTFLENGWSKAILRNAMKDKLPKEIVYRKDKVGFEAPHNKWLGNPIFEKVYKNSFDYLYKNQIINNDYNDKWKVIIASKFLQQ
jgi:asparagine synthase (glutamine-hydrolysing)